MGYSVYKGTRGIAYDVRNEIFVKIQTKKDHHFHHSNFGIEFDEIVSCMIREVFDKNYVKLELYFPEYETGRGSIIPFKRSDWYLMVSNFNVIPYVGK